MALFRSNSWRWFQSSFSRYQQYSPKHQTQINSGSPVQLAITKHESITMVQSRRNRKAPVSWMDRSQQKGQEAAWIPWAAFLSTKSWQVKISEDEPSIATWANARVSSYSVGLFCGIFFLNIMYPLKHLLPQNFTTWLCTRQLLENHHVWSQQNILS